MPALKAAAAKGGRSLPGVPTVPLIATGPFGRLSAERVATLIARGLQQRGTPAAEELALAGGDESRVEPLEPLDGHHLDARVRAVPDARVSCPLEWAEVAEVDPGELRLDTVPARLAKRGDPSAEIDERPAALEPLLELAARDEREGLGDAPWPPHFRKQKGEPPRVQPSRARAAKR